MSDVEHGIIHQAITNNGYGCEIVCRCGHLEGSYGAGLPTFGALLSKHMADVSTRQAEAMLARKRERYWLPEDAS